MDEIFTRIDTFRPSSTQVRLPAEPSQEYRYYYNGVEDVSQRRYTNQIAAQTVSSYEYFNEDAPLQGRVV